jgi:hypothetical protein
VLAVHGLGWWILDHILGPSTPVSVDAFWHLHPGWRGSSVGPHVALLTQEHHALTLASTAPLLLVPPGESPLAVWSPDYGVVEPAPTAQGSIEVSPPATIATFIPATSAITSGVNIESLPVERPAAGWHTASFRLRWDRGEMLLLAAIEPAEIASDRDAAPATRWGTAEFQTDARLALVVKDGHGWSEAVLVNGAELHVDGDALVALPHRLPLVRMTQLAPAVHEVP